jgi:hypothetical protein
MRFVPMKSSAQLAARVSSPSLKAWLEVAGQHMRHALEGQGLDVYEPGLGDAAYKERIELALLRSYLEDPAATDTQGLAALQDAQAGTLAARARSAALFDSHLGHLFTRDASRGEGYLGDLTFVYPIAATTAGPFDQPGEQFVRLGIEGTVEARWWSDKWQDEFGGLPFLLINYAGIAFHGPISHNDDLDMWYLRRSFVSHGCHRMDASDLLELRTILPDDFASLVDRGKGIPTRILEWPDVTDWDGDGALEAIDVAYYTIPAEVPVPAGQTPAQAAAPWLGEPAKRAWRRAHYTEYDDRLKSRNSYSAAEEILRGTVRYELSGGKLIRNGYFDAVPVFAFETRPNRIIQYRENSVAFKGYNDGGGKYPPEFFY